MEKASGEMSLTEQLEACRAYAQWRGYDVATETSEENTGDAIERVQLNVLEALALQLAAEVVICYKPDRLATDEKLRAQYEGELAGHGVHIKYAHPPVKMKIADPTTALPGWAQERTEWIELNREIDGHPLFSPLTIKAAYVIGVIHQLCQCITVLLRAPVHQTVGQIHPWLSPQPRRHPWQTTYIPAYGLLASGINLLGRCLRGNDNPAKESTEDIEAGFKWLSNPRYNPAIQGDAAFGYHGISKQSTLITTSTQSYSIDQLVKMRHYAAHGQAVAVGYSFPDADYEILAKMPVLLADGLEHFWGALIDHVEPCNRLAKARILAYLGTPILASWIVFDIGTDDRNHSITEIFKEFDWRV